MVDNRVGNVLDAGRQSRVTMTNIDKGSSLLGSMENHKVTVKWLLMAT